MKIRVREVIVLVVGYRTLRAAVSPKKRDENEELGEGGKDREEKKSKSKNKNKNKNKSWTWGPWIAVALNRIHSRGQKGS